jgi:hypothetical protein
VFAGFEVRVGKADEDLAELTLAEEVGEELHGVGTETGGILVGTSRVLGAESPYFLLDVGCDL